MLPKDGQQFKNRILEQRSDFASITDTFTTFLDIGEAFICNHLIIQSSLNEIVELRFNGVDTITIDPNEAFGLDDFNHNGIIEVKHQGTAPTTGQIKTRSW